MPAASLLTLLDDITMILDDVWIMTQLSAKKTAGVLGDDLALNAEQVVGLAPERELPVILAVAKGSARNKALLIPLALLLRALAPGLIQPMLMVGGLYLCYEGIEKLLHRRQHQSHPSKPPSADEPEKIAGAVRTDLILSAEILALTLGLVAHLDLMRVVLVLLAISLLMTVGVYGLVGIIVKLDDLGLALQKRPGAGQRRLGRLILATAPKMLWLISWLGTLAIFCVGGGILAHGLHLVENLNPIQTLLAEGLVGLLGGALATLGVRLLQRLRPGSRSAGS